MDSTPGTSQVTGAKKKRRKRGKAKYTHYKLGSTHGWARKSNESQGEDHTLEPQDISFSENSRTSQLSADVPVPPSSHSLYSHVPDSPVALPEQDTEVNTVTIASSCPATPVLPSTTLTVESTLERNNADSNSKDNAGVFVDPPTDLVLDVKAKLERGIHLPWIIVQEDDGINVMLLSSGPERAVQRRAFFSFDGTEDITVHQKTLGDKLVSNIFKDNSDKIPLSEGNEDKFVEKVVQVINNFKSYEVCVGVYEEEFQGLWLMDKNPWREAKYSKTFRHNDCEILLHSLRYRKRRCQNCLQVLRRFRKRLPHHVFSEASPNTPNAYLSREQLIVKINKQQKDLTYAKSQIKILQCNLADSIEKQGIDESADLSNDLCNILKDSNLTPVQALFFEEQLKALDAKKACGRRWHPTLIQFALLLRTPSGAAYRAIRDSGVIVLPSERTLYDYSHVISPDPGCTKEKLDRVAKIVQKKHPETYQSYHVLLIDEMYIQQKLVYLKGTGIIIGYVELSEAEKKLALLEAELNNKDTTDTQPLASKVFCYVIKGVASSISEVVASYVTTDALDCEKLYDMTWEVRGCLERSGLRVIASVSDVAAVNRSFYDMHMHIPLTKTSGVIFDTANLCAPWRPLYFLSDVPHLLKTIRNCFYKSGSGRQCTRLLTKNGQVIIWDTIKKLYEEDRLNTVRRCFKLSFGILKKGKF